MDADSRRRAEARLQAAAAAAGLADPRPWLRERLLRLRGGQPDAFERAIRHYEQNVLPALAAADALAAWIEYAAFTARLSAVGQLTAIDATGRARSFVPPVEHGALVVFLPDDPAAAALVAAQPLQPSPAQAAALDLLVHRGPDT
jgi:hypothetical protein